MRGGPPTSRHAARLTSEGDALVFLEHAVGPGDGHVFVGQQGDVHVAEAALPARRVNPGQVAEVRVRGTRQHLGMVTESTVNGDQPHHWRHVN